MDTRAHRLRTLFTVGATLAATGCGVDSSEQTPIDWAADRVQPVEERLLRAFEQGAESSQPEGYDVPADGSVEVVFRGQPTEARVYGTEIVVEGDIVLGYMNQDRKGVVRQGVGFQWPGGVVPFVFDASVLNAQQTDIQDAMDEREAAVPGLQFVARGTQTDFVRFRVPAGTTTDPNRCNSFVGRRGGSQNINVTNGCILSHSVHHEIAHTLGLYHEHTRENRGGSVQINWSAIRGCLATATSRASCGVASCSAVPPFGGRNKCGCTANQVNSNTSDQSNRFQNSGGRMNVSGYDFDLVMHYPSTAFAVPGRGATLTVLQNDPATGTPWPIGQRNHLSVGDQVSMRVLYPDAYLHRSAFRDAAPVSLCRLRGRSEDANTLLSVSGQLPSANLSSGLLNTAGLAEGDYAVTCTATSGFWSSDYNYPATAASVDPSSLPVASQESYVETGTVRIMSPGLIALM